MHSYFLLGMNFFMVVWFLQVPICALLDFHFCCVSETLVNSSDSGMWEHTWNNLWMPLLSNVLSFCLFSVEISWNLRDACAMWCMSSNFSIKPWPCGYSNAGLRWNWEDRLYVQSLPRVTYIVLIFLIYLHQISWLRGGGVMTS